jgi:hypothetical protein
MMVKFDFEDLHIREMVLRNHVPQEIWLLTNGEAGISSASNVKSVRIRGHVLPGWLITNGIKRKWKRQAGT